MLFHYYIFSILCIVDRWAAADHYSKDRRNGEELILCRKCGSDVADSYYLISKPSPGAKRNEKRNLFGKTNVTLQTLVNPFGVRFEIVTTEKANCENVGPAQGADSWFPGYTWRICACPRCGQHLGWTFEHSQKGMKVDDMEEQHIKQFHGLIMTNILGENYSLIMMPKMYTM